MVTSPVTEKSSDEPAFPADLHFCPLLGALFKKTTEVRSASPTLSPCWFPTHALWGTCFPALEMLVVPSVVCCFLGAQEPMLHFAWKAFLEGQARVFPFSVFPDPAGGGSCSYDLS